MAFIDKVLKVPTYGWADENGELIVPSKKQLYKEFFFRLNFFKNKKNWISAISWVKVLCLFLFFIPFVVYHLSFVTLTFFVLYAMIIMSTHGTIWFHRYCTHRAYTFSHPIWRIITQNLVIKTFPEEIYVISHHVHHAKSDQPGDPYNPKGGLMYCMMSDVNHQSIAEDLTESDYKRAANFMTHTGVQINSYEQYQKWGSVATLPYTILLWIINWSVWYAIFYFIGGHAIATAAFSAAMFWFVLVRAFNYTGHGKGDEAHKDGIDFDRSNLSINQTRPGWFSGEWHNNHHLYPTSARAGFLPYQLDLAWIYIYCLNKIGMISSFKNYQREFLKKYIHIEKP
ncbi:fatty acid desaturase [Ekhidna sp.]|uniref:fatty acid desaturase n=1 Tax=Ekhidna sp. TaxID=2608089 RepID=UPI003296DCD7